MSEPGTAARTARENLARALAALQQPGVPAALMNVANPVANAMSTLHHIETTGSVETAGAALASVRQALAMLQTQPAGLPAVDQAIEAVAGSLGLIHGLAAAMQQPTGPVMPGAPSPRAPAPAAPAPGLPGGGPPAAAPAGPPGPLPGFAPAGAALPGAAPWQQAAPAAPAHPANQSPAAFAGTVAMNEEPGPPQPAPAAPGWGQPGATPQPGWGAAPQQAPAPPAPGWGGAPAAQGAGAPGPGWPPQPGAPLPAAAPAPPVPAPAAGPFLRVDADLGAHSATNFYKGLSGNDVVDDGGLFVATYQIPPLGQNLILHVSLPGGYEFEAKGVVRWTREAPDSGGAAPPGFGAKLLDITPEGRQLVYRYVRNREPLFHDDL